MNCPHALHSYDPITWPPSPTLQPPFYSLPCSPLPISPSSPIAFKYYDVGPWEGEEGKDGMRLGAKSQYVWVRNGAFSKGTRIRKCRVEESCVLTICPWFVRVVLLSAPLLSFLICPAQAHGCTPTPTPSPQWVCHLLSAGVSWRLGVSDNVEVLLGRVGIHVGL